MIERLGVRILAQAYLFTFVCCVIVSSVQRPELVGSGCGSVGRAVDSDSRGLRFKSSHWQKFIYIEHLFTVNCVLKRRK